MPIEITRTAYYYSDLEGKAKEKAIDWMEARLTEWFTLHDVHHVIYDFTRICNDLGITLHVNTSGPAVYWELSYSQSDGVSFDGIWRGTPPGNTELIKAVYPKETKLHGIAELLETETAKYFFAEQEMICVEITASNRRNYFNLSFETAVELGEISETTIEGCIRALNLWLYEEIREEYEHQTGREAAHQRLTNDEWDAKHANETPTYLFNADGTVFK
jgi:hypothetical protein